MKNSIRDRKQIDDSLELSADIDFRGGERGKYAHRFGEVERDEELAAQYLVGQGFRVARIGADRFAKTPDFRLLKDGKLVAYCEVKTFERDVWLDRMLVEAPSGSLAGGARPDPVYNRISNAIHTAAKQLASANQDHGMLNILVLMNRDNRAKYQDLVSVTTGKWDPLAGIHDKTHEQLSEGRIREEKSQIDLYVWLDAYKDDPPKLRGFFFGNYESRPKVCLLFGIDPDAVKTVA
jgi:hypothetical protein